MKKITLAILAIFFVVFGNSIVGTWIWECGEDRMEFVFNSDGTGTELGVGKYGYERYPFDWEAKNGYIFIFVPNDDGGHSHTVSFAYSGGNEFTLHETVLTRVNPTSITTRQRAQAQSNFQISRNSNSLHLNFADNSEKRVEIVNLQGRVLNSQSFSAKTRSVDISSLTRGVFVLRVFDGAGVGVVRFVRE